MSITLTPEVLAELRELERKATSEPHGCVLADKAIAALPALLDAAEELARVKRWAKVQGNVCPTCADKLPCPNRMDRLIGSCDEWSPGWNEEATK